MNSFKGLDVVNRVPKQLCTEVPNTAQEMEINSIPKKNKCRQAKWLFEEASKIAEKREVKGKKKGKMNPMNAEFQRILKGDKKGFLHEQRKEMEENNRMGKTRDLFKKSGKIFREYVMQDGHG